MRKLLTICLLLVVAASLNAAAQTAISVPEEHKVISQISDDLYYAEIKDADGFILKKGMYWTDGSQLKHHGTWSLYAHQSDEVLTTIRFDKGETLWIETVIDGQKMKVNKEQLAAYRLQTAKKSSEQKLAENKEN